MKKEPLLNAPLSGIIAAMGHTDSLVLCDAGLPIPESSKRIDLAVTYQVPSFMQVLDTVGDALCVEKALLAEEIKTHNPTVHQAILDKLASMSAEQGNTIAIEYVSHETFKVSTHNSKAIVRTGECSPYANIILYSGVVF